MVLVELSLTTFRTYRIDTGMLVMEHVDLSALCVKVEVGVEVVETFSEVAELMDTNNVLRLVSPDANPKAVENLDKIEAVSIWYLTAVQSVLVTLKQSRRLGSESTKKLPELANPQKLSDSWLTNQLVPTFIFEKGVPGGKLILL